MTNKRKNTPLPYVSASSARTGRVHWARLATQGANSIQLTYSQLWPIVSDFDEIKGNFGQFGGVLFMVELEKATERAERGQIGKRC